MKKVILALLVLTLFVPATMNAEAPELSAPIRQFVDAFNKGDVKAIAAAHASGDVYIIDEFGRHLWTGPKAVKNWADEWEKFAKAEGITDASVSCGALTVTNVDGDAAYVTVPSVYNYKLRGKAMTEPANMAIVLVKQSGTWKIRGWAWTGTVPQPAQ